MNLLCVLLDHDWSEPVKHARQKLLIVTHPDGRELCREPYVEYHAVTVCRRCFVCDNHYLYGRPDVAWPDVEDVPVSYGL